MYREEIKRLAKYQRESGKTLKEISTNLHISVPTVQCLSYKRKIQKKKLGRKCAVTKRLSNRIKCFVAKRNSDHCKVTA